jgi:hypothetical protein
MLLSVWITLKVKTKIMSTPNGRIFAASLISFRHKLFQAGTPLAPNGPTFPDDITHMELTLQDINETKAVFLYCPTWHHATVNLMKDIHLRYRSDNGVWTPISPDQAINRFFTGIGLYDPQLEDRLAPAFIDFDYENGEIKNVTHSSS